MINIEHLNPDEVEIEYLIRGLGISDIAQLKAHVDIEKVTPALVVKKPHSAAKKNPK